MAKIVRESLNESVDLEKSRLETQFGYIDHGYCSKCKEYPNGLLVFMGSYVYKEYRGQGKFKEMVRELFEKYPEGTTVHVPVENKVLVDMFERMGFRPVERIEYWGELSNAKTMEGTITKEAKNLL